MNKTVGCTGNEKFQVPKTAAKMDWRQTAHPVNSAPTHRWPRKVHRAIFWRRLSVHGTGSLDTVINDANADLIGFYRCLQQDVSGFIDVAQPVFSAARMSAEAYLSTRARFNAGGTNVERAALLLSLKKFGLNGLYRVNKKGKLNVPYGHPKTLPTFPRQALLDMAPRLQNVHIMCGDYKLAMALATAGDVVYCHLPYLDASSNKA